MAAQLPEAYRRLTPKEKGQHVVGQLFWIPAYLHMNDYYVVRVGAWDRTQQIATARFQIEKKTLDTLSQGSDLFHHMPIPELKVGATEELIVKKVKRRPAVMVLREGVNPRRLATHLSGQGPKPNPATHVFAPIVSLVKEHDASHAYPAEFVEKVKQGGLPEFLYLPGAGDVISNESMAVLTELQTHGEQFVEETDLCIKGDYLADSLDRLWQDITMSLIADDLAGSVPSQA